MSNGCVKMVLEENADVEHHMEVEGLKEDMTF